MPAKAWLARILAAGLLLGGGTARAVDVTARIEPSYQSSTSSTSDETGRTSKTNLNGWLQLYSLNLEERLFPKFRLLGYGFYESAMLTGSTDGLPVESETRRWTVTGRAAMGDPSLNATLGYDRSARSADSLSGGLATLGTDLVRQIWSLLGTWRPEGLPLVTLRLSHSDLFDERRTGTDQTTDEVNVGAVYASGGLEARYRMSWQDLADRLAQTDTANLSNGLRLSYANRILADRVSLYGSYELVHRVTDTRATGTSGTVATQQFPVADLSAIEAFPATPDRVALSPNGVLIDGDTVAGAGLNLGFGPSLTGDDAYRDLGVQLADVVTPVNTVWVWVDRPLPAPVAGAIIWTAYRSDDNLNWTQVPLAGLVAFAPFNNRFEIPIAETRARYLKVVAKPLAAAVTTDARYRDILVTEMQVLQVVAAESVRGRTWSLRGDASASARVRILTSVPLSYDFGATLSHDNARPGVRYSLANGLSLNATLAPPITLDARLERTDFDAGQGRESLSRGSVALGAQPLPTLSGNLAYTGQLQQAPRGDESAHNLVLFVRAEPYRGVTFNASGGYTLSAPADGGSGRQGTVQVGVGLTPNKWLVLGGNWGSTSSRFSGGTRGELKDVQSRLEGTATVNPVPAIFASGSLARVVSNGLAYTLLNVSGSVSPFPGGDLYLGFAYNETLDTRTDLRVRGWGPSMRWKIRSSTYFDANYNVLDSTSPSQDIHQRVFTARLSLVL